MPNREYKIMELSELVDIIPGYQFRQKLHNEESGSIMVLQPGDVQTGEINFKALRKVVDTNFPEKYFAQLNDVAFLARGQNDCAVCVGNAPAKLLLTNYFFILRPRNDSVTPEFICWCLSQNFAQRIIHKERRGTTVPLVPKKALESITIPVPTIDKQKLIVELFDLLKKEEQLQRAIHNKRANLLENQVTQFLLREQHGVN